MYVSVSTRLDTLASMGNAGPSSSPYEASKNGFSSAFEVADRRGAELVHHIRTGVRDTLGSVPRRNVVTQVLVASDVVQY